jgi:hypothetical protein
MIRVVLRQRTVPVHEPLHGAQEVGIAGRAFALFDCLPVKYTAGEMDASSSEVSVQELTVQPEFWTELSMATLSRSLGTVGAIGGAVAGAGLNVVSGLL